LGATLTGRISTANHADRKDNLTGHGTSNAVTAFFIRKNLLRLWNDLLPSRSVFVTVRHLMRKSPAPSFAALVVCIVLGCLAPVASRAQTNGPATNQAPDEAIALIKEQGLTTNSQAMAILSYLSDVIGERLTGSPNLKRANQWTKMKLESWGLTNAHLEPWGPFGRGWELKHFSAQIVEPQVFPLIACPQAWSPGLDKPLTANVIYLGGVATSNLDGYKGKLAGAIVLVSPMHEIVPRLEPLFARQTESNLTRLAHSAGDADRFRGRPAGSTNRFAGNENRPSPARLLAFLQKEKVGLAVSESSQGEGGTIFVASATVPSTNTSGFRGRQFNGGPAGRNGGTNDGGFRGGGRGGPSAYSLTAPAMPPQITLAAEDYNRLVRMLRQGVKLKMEVDLKVKYHTEDPMAYNTIAEIPGTDLKDQIVMLGGHMDSWQAGTGATDNGAGVAAAMEAVRIIEAAHLHPRRTIRIALWTGEEEGLLGSKAYVSNHFGNYGANGAPNRFRDRRAFNADTAGGASTNSAEGATNQPAPPKFIPGPEFEKLSVYFNLDNGAGKIRGIYMQGDEAAGPIFTKWLEPFHSEGAETVTVSRTGSTDHISFDSVGLPGFQFIQDPLDYMTRSHHSNEDVFDRIQADDLKQAATVMAAFVYNAAMIDEKIPRKPVTD
jgi:carboxypeptidase Q